MSTKIVDKIAKLLAIAGNTPSPNEAAATFARAQALATKHRIELASVEAAGDLDAEDPMVRESVQAVKGKRVMGWKKSLAWGMRPLGVYVLFYQGRGSFTFAGRKGDVDTARYMYHAISAEIERLAREQAQGQGRAYANAFKMGAARTVVSRLKEMHESTIEHARNSGVSETALARVDDACKAAERWIKSDLGVRVGIAAPSRCSSLNGLEAGSEAGHGINLGAKTAIGRGNLALGAGAS